MSRKTCGKCRLHGKIEPLKGHKRVCPYGNCSCSRCSTHDETLAIRYSQRDAREDKGKRWIPSSWRSSLLSDSQNSRTATTTAKTTTRTLETGPSFPEMKPSTSNVDDALVALQVANFETSKQTVEKMKPKADQRKARQQRQLQKHKTLFKSVNSYAQEIAGATKELSPLAVLKTAILLHQRQPREESEALATAPTVQAELHTLSPAQLQFDNQLDKLKKVLPFASEVKLASLLVREKGNMNAVVQQILDSGTTGEQDQIDGGTRVIDLTDEETECSSEPATTSDNLQNLDLTQVSVDTSVLKNILETVNKNETASAASPCPDSNLLSFYRANKNPASTCVVTENINSKKLSEAPQSSCKSIEECPYCFRANEQQGPFCNFCGGIFQKNHHRW